jgi:hypothetical protein
MAMPEQQYWRGWRTPTAEIPVTLGEALAWLGLRHGRAAMYLQLSQEFAEGRHSAQHFFAYNEACTILDIYLAWKDKADAFPGIREKIHQVFKKGPILAENESGSSNKPRNDGFELVLAGKLLHVSGVEVVSVDGIHNTALAHGTASGSPPDISIRYEGVPINIECKRPLILGSLADAAQDALDQINDPAREIRHGVIAVDLSRAIRDSYYHFEGPSNQEASQELTRQVQQRLEPVARRPGFMAENILGFIGHIRVPYVVPGTTRIVKLDGSPYRHHFTSSASCYLMIKNGECPHGSLLHPLSASFMKTEHDVHPASLPLER